MSRASKITAALLQGQALREAQARLNAAPSRQGAERQGNSPRNQEPHWPGRFRDHPQGLGGGTTRSQSAAPRPAPSPKPPSPTLSPGPLGAGPKLTEGNEPMILTIDQFFGYVFAWADTNVPNIRRVWPLQGGWEAWAQAEIAGYINEIDASTSIIREARVYNEGRRADFLLNQATTNQYSQQVVVEMKCESLHNQGAFISGVNKDVAKVQTKLQAPFNQCQKVTLAIFFSQEAANSLAELGYTLQTSQNEIGVAVHQW